MIHGLDSHQIAEDKTGMYSGAILTHVWMRHSRLRFFAVNSDQCRQLEAADPWLNINAKKTELILFGTRWILAKYTSTAT